MMAVALEDPCFSIESHSESYSSPGKLRISAELEEVRVFEIITNEVIQHVLAMCLICLNISRCLPELLGRRLRSVLGDKGINFI